MGLAQNSAPVSPLTLDQAISLAENNSPTARNAVQLLAQAQAAIGEADAQRHYQLMFNSTASGSNADVIQPPPAHETFGTLQNSLTVPLPIGPKPDLAVRQAQEQFAVAQAQYRGALLNLATKIASSYYDLLRKSALLRSAQESGDLAQSELSDAQKRFDAGDVPQLDVLQAEVPAANASAQIVQAQTAFQISQQTLDDLLSRPLDELLTLQDISEVPAELPFSLKQALEMAMDSSPDVAAADAAVRADQAALESAKLWREPSVALQAIDARSGDQTSFSRDDTLQISASLPLYDGGLGGAQTQTAQAALAQAQAQAELARRAVLVNVNAAYLTAQSSLEQVTATRYAKEIAQTTYDKTVVGYKDGLNPLVNVLAAQNALAQAQIAYIQALYDAASAHTSALLLVQGVSPAVGIPAQAGERLP